MGHVSKNTTNMDWEQGDDNSTDQFLYYRLKFVHNAVEAFAIDNGHSDAKNKGNEQGTHNTHQRWHIDFEVRCQQRLLRICR